MGGLLGGGAPKRDPETERLAKVAAAKAEKDRVEREAREGQLRSARAAGRFGQESLTFAGTGGGKKTLLG